MERIAMVLAAVVLITLTIMVQASVWNECRTDHSFFYCMTLMSHK